MGKYEIKHRRHTGEWIVRKRLSDNSYKSICRGMTEKTAQHICSLLNGERWISKYKEFFKKWVLLQSLKEAKDDWGNGVLSIEINDKKYYKEIELANDIGSLRERIKKIALSIIEQS